MADIESYAPTVNMDAPKGNLFTVSNLLASGITSLTLYAMDMPNDFYEGLLVA